MSCMCHTDKTATKMRMKFTYTSGLTHIPQGSVVVAWYNRPSGTYAVHFHEGRTDAYVNAILAEYLEAF